MTGLLAISTTIRSCLEVMRVAKLEPCPFCGSTAVIESFAVRKGYEANVQCTGCLAVMPTVAYDLEETAFLEAKRTWNMRVKHG